MPGDLTPGQMFDHELNAVKGWGADLHVLDKAFKPKAGEAIFAGMGVYLDPTTPGQAIAGVAGAAMVIFAFQNQDDFDANSDFGNISGGVGSGLVASGGYELETTEFVAGSYDPQDVLTVESAGVDKGKLKEGTLYVDPICGVVSDGVAASDHNNFAVNRRGSPTINLLRFWSVWLPPIPGGWTPAP